MVQVQSASSFRKLVLSQVIKMMTLKEDTQIRRVCVYDMDKPYDRLLLISQKGGVSLDWPCLDTLTVIQADATSSSSLRLLPLCEEIPHKPGNWNEKNRETVVAIVDGSEKQ